MSDDGNRHDHPPTAGEQNFSENGSENTENDQSGLPPWAAALTAQVTAQLQASFTAQLSANQEALRAALEENVTFKEQIEETLLYKDIHLFFL